MITRINELRGRLADQGQRQTWDEISAATGIRKATLLAMSKGRLKQWRPEYVDALCAYFNISVDQLLVAESVKLPLQLYLRPDRAGKKVGERSAVNGTLIKPDPENEKEQAQAMFDKLKSMAKKAEDE